MTEMQPNNHGRIALLPDRGVVRVSGPDADKLLQGLLTNDLGRIARQGAIHAALLTPQGKILFAMMVVADGDDRLLEVPADQAGALVKRLMLYRLRARVEIADATSGWTVLALWGAAAPPAPEALPSGACLFADPRAAGLGWRLLVPGARPADPQELPALAGGWHVAEAGVHLAHRIGEGVPEFGEDYLTGEVFPHEALLDRQAGVDFRKGCYVGQEVVSRMEHRGTARSRFVRVRGEAALPPRGSEVRAGETPLGVMGSSAGRLGLALLRLDRLARALEAGTAIAAGTVVVEAELPDWARGAAGTGPEAGKGVAQP